jgi:hypothetical protein
MRTLTASGDNGSLAIKEVLSNVGNNQGVSTTRTQQGVYRSDKINLQVNYSEQNPDGQSAAV